MAVGNVMWKSTVFLGMDRIYPKREGLVLLHFSIFAHKLDILPHCLRSDVFMLVAGDMNSERTSVTKTHQKTRERIHEQINIYCIRIDREVN